MIKVAVIIALQHQQTRHGEGERGRGATCDHAASSSSLPPSLLQTTIPSITAAVAAAAALISNQFSHVHRGGVAIAIGRCTDLNGQAC